MHWLRWQLQLTAMPPRKTCLPTPSAVALQKPPLHQGPAAWSGKTSEDTDRQVDVTLVSPSLRMQLTDADVMLRLALVRRDDPVPMVSCCARVT